ncbi:MAG: hypothetical protein NTY80_02025 [candidate division SR1 bacterium]|nr:hypothetical protein [candidate division SR1 bacterium]
METNEQLETVEGTKEFLESLSEEGKKNLLKATKQELETVIREGMKEEQRINNIRNSAIFGKRGTE